MLFGIKIKTGKKHQNEISNPVDLVGTTSVCTQKICAGDAMERVSTKFVILQLHHNNLIYN